METLQNILAVIAVLGLLGATVWWLRRRGLVMVRSLPLRRANGVLRSVERLPLSSTHTLHLVRAGDHAILLACSPAGCQVVEIASWSHYAKEEGS